MPRVPLLRSPLASAALLVTLLGGTTAGIAVATPSRAAPPAVATGRIEGTVVLSTALSTRRPRFRPYAERGQVAQVPARAEEQDERRNVVVYLKGDSGSFKAFKAFKGSDSLKSDFKESDPLKSLNATPAVRQAAERFLPHVLPVVTGTAVAFPNDDAVYHNVFSLSSARTFDLGRYPRGASRSVTFAKPGTVQVFCHIHGDMSAIVLVLENPFFAQPQDEGRYAIDSVPEGEYTIVGWHERIRPVTRRIRVVAGETTAADFNIPLPLAAASR